MKRKVIKQGNQAFTLTLPIDWVRKNKVDKNLELDVKEEGKSLLINSSGEVEGGRVKLDLSGQNTRVIFIHVSSLYAKGIDEIEIISKEDISQKLIKAAANTIGYAVVLQEKERYIIKDISGGKYPDIEEIFKRVFQMILMFYEACMNDVFGEEKETADNLKLRDREINKFCLYLQRAINKMSYPDAIRGRSLFTYAFELEKISDEVERAWRTNVQYKIKKTKEIKQLMDKVKEGLEESFDSYYMFNPKKVEIIRLLRDKVRKDSQKIKITDGNTFRFIRHLVKIIEEAADLSQLNVMMRLKE